MFHIGNKLPPGNLCFYSIKKHPAKNPECHNTCKAPDIQQPIHYIPTPVLTGSGSRVGSHPSQPDQYSQLPPDKLPISIRSMRNSVKGKNF